MTSVLELQRARFADLMRQYAKKKAESNALKEQKSAVDGELDNLRELMRIEAMNLGIVRGSKLKFENLGSFTFQKKTYYSVPKEHRGEFARLLAGRQEHALLTINKTDLADWCEDMQSIGEKVPDYVAVKVDEFVPYVSLARRGQAAAGDDQRGNEQ